MPNWVSNTLSITGSAEDIADFKEKASQPKTTLWDGKEEIDEAVLSFMNFIAPPQDALASGEYYGTHGWSEGKEVGRTPNNWYEFNSREWGTKWDASDEELTDESEMYLSYSFQTAWAPPTPVFQAMAEQHPTLVFEIHCVEEQGWGVDYEGRDGELTTTDEWDIPDSHESSIYRTNSCYCEWADPITDREHFFSDCPQLDLEEAIRILEEVNPRF
jgi:hypothetical protein